MLAILLVTLVCATAKSQITLPASEIQSLFNSDDKTIIDRNNVQWYDKLNDDCLIDCINMENGNANFTIHFNGNPGVFEFAVCRNSKGKNFNLTIEQSNDNSSWSQLYSGEPEYRSDFNNKLSFTPNVDTRYIRFTYKSDKDLWLIGSYSICHISNIKINKAIYIEQKDINVSGKINEPISTNISVNIENLKGDLIAISDNPEISVTPERISQSDAVGKTNVFTATYNTNIVKNAVANISFVDEGYSDNYENVKATFGILPSKPVANDATEVGSNKFTANWTGTEGFKYLVTVKKGEDVLSQYDNLECEGNSLVVTDLEANTTYTYTVKESNGIDTSEESNAIEVTTKTPSITVSEIEEFATSENAIVSKELTINSEYLASDIILKLTNDTVFTLDKDTIQSENGQETVKITYTPSIYGEENDKLTISSDFVEDIVIDLYGYNALATPVALEAENITNSGFTAKWEKVNNATDYVLTVTDTNGEPIVQYDRKNTGDTDSYNVNNLKPSTSYTYYVQAVCNDYIFDEISNTIDVTTTEGAVITMAPEFKDFITVNNSTSSQTVNVSGSNVFSNITVSIQGDDCFTCDYTTIPADGSNITVTYSPTSIGINSATLTLSAQGAESVSIELKGISTPDKVTVIEAENINTTSFTARWNETNGAESYILSVYKGDKVLDEYNEVNVTGSTSYEVKGLEEATFYNYTVKAVNGESVGTASERMSVQTLFTPVISMVSANSSIISIKWNEPMSVDKYTVTLKENGTAVANYNNVETESPAFSFINLKANTTYTCQVSAIFGETKIASTEATLSTTDTKAGTKQLNNSGFEDWEGSGNSYEPVSWNSFGSGTGSLIGTAVQFTGTRLEESSDVRPGTKGSKSVRIWTGSTFGVNANGNLTTGRINAGSMTADDPQNYNFTDINDEAFNEKLGTRPDSITVWVKYTSKNAESKARVSAIIHDNYSYRDPSGSDPQSPNHVVATAESNFPSNGGGWQRLSIPFVYKGNSLSPDFMLVSLTSNMTPGGGDANDEIIADDIQLIYKPTLKAGNVEKSSYKAGETITLNYEISGSMSVSNINAGANTVSLQLSDASGSFASARNLATITTDESGALVGTIPSDVTAGKNYKLRIVTTNYPMTAEAANSFEITNSTTAKLSYTGETYFEANIGGYSAKQNLTVKGENIEGNIFIKSNSNVFTISKEVLPAEGGTVTVTYTPTTIGEENAELTIYAKNAESVTVKLNGKANAPSSISENHDNGNDIAVYPNPVQDIANITGTDIDAAYCIYSLDGKMMKAGRLVFSTVDVSELPGGIYIIVIDNKKIKFVK